MKKLIVLLILLLPYNPALAAQKTVTVGTSGSQASLDTNFGNTQDNFTELYTDKGTQDTAIGLNTAKDTNVVQAADRRVPEPVP